MTDWKAGGEEYLPLLNAAEDTYALPRDLLARVAYQESHWRTDIVDGTVKSPTGAVGLMQLEPQFFPGAGADWRADILTAAKYLANLHHEFQDWQLAIAAYDWGPGDVAKYRAGIYKVLPTETFNYVHAVFTDVPVSGSLMSLTET
jgi:soluble lytic murein transglycosylase-like protein